MSTSDTYGRRLAAAALLLAAIGLSGCGSDNDNRGGGGGDTVAGPAPGGGMPAPPTADNSIPASAGTSVTAFIAYLRGLRTDETSAPVRVGAFVAPVDDAAAPTSLAAAP